MSFCTHKGTIYEHCVCKGYVADDAFKSAMLALVTCVGLSGEELQNRCARCGHDESCHNGEGEQPPKGKCNVV